MATETLEERVSELENRVKEMEELLAMKNSSKPPAKRGWRWFVGIDADNPDFDEAVRLGREWRFADSPKDEEEAS